MNISDSLDQYADICRDAIKRSSTKLNKRFDNLLIEKMLLYMIVPRKINFTQMERYDRLLLQFHEAIVGDDLREQVTKVNADLIQIEMLQATVAWHCICS